MLDLSYSASRCQPTRRATFGFTLVEMLIAMAITLVMMAAVVTVFANVSDSVRNRRATIELSGSVRLAREALQRDLAAVTCPAMPTQRPESNHGYIELIEGPHSDFDPSLWLRDRDDNGIPDDVDGSGPLPALDLAVSGLPSSNQLRLPGATAVVSGAPTDGRGLGDWDDTLAFTARNEEEPFVGRVPDNTGAAFANWTFQVIESPLAEVIWFAVENPVEANETFYFGEPGFRTIYRRTLLIAPQLNFAFTVGGQVTGPGVMRVLGSGVGLTDVDVALASLIAFQERYDLSVRLEWDPQLAGGRWTIVANSLADLTKRENRYEHYGFSNPTTQRSFPFAATLLNGGGNLSFVGDPELTSTRAMGSAAADGIFTITDPGAYQNAERPFVFVGGAVTTARAIVNEDGQVVAVTNGYVPLGGARRGQDVILTDVLAFDLRVFDPDAPLLAQTNNVADPGSVVEPGDVGWGERVRVALNAPLVGGQSTLPLLVGRGAYVDLGYFNLHRAIHAANTGLTNFPDTTVDPAMTNASALGGGSVFAALPNPRSQLAAPGTLFELYRLYDTWSFHYENNGINEDGDTILAANGSTVLPYIDEGTDGLDVPTVDVVAPAGLTQADLGERGPDDPSEFETAPPYNTPLRGVQVTLRAYERDSRSIREVKVRQTFIPE